ncbi:ACP S-malonyltransferase, partial [Nocardia gipuzkoensis]
MGSVSDVLCAADAPGIDEMLRTNPDLLQLAIYGTSVAAYRLALARGMRPDVLVGHSFGEIAALVCGGAFTVTEGAEIVCHRDAALAAMGEVDGYQLALSADVAAVEQILLLIGDPRAVVAVENHAGQTVIAGPRGAIETAQAIAAALRIGAVPLKSAYPFHSPMLSEAAFEFAARIRHIPRQRPRVEVYSPILGPAYRDGDDLAVALA